MEIRDILEEYLADLEIRRFSPRTIETRKITLRVFLRYCDDNGIEDSEDITFSTVKKYTKHMLDKGNKPSSVNARLTAIKSFIAYMWENELGGFNTKSRRWTWVKEEKVEVVAFTSNELRDMLEKSKKKGNPYLSSRNHCMFCLLIGCGLRSFELRGMRMQDVHDDYIVIHGKGNKTRVIPIDAVTKKSMIRYERERKKHWKDKAVGDYYFLSTHGNQVSKSGLDCIVKSLADNSESGARISCHTLRHSFAHESLKQGMDVVSISYLMGHSDLETTSRYLQGFRDSERLEMARKNSVLMKL